MLISRKCGYAQRFGIADMSEDFWNLADSSWDFTALDPLPSHYCHVLLTPNTIKLRPIFVSDM